MEFIHTQSRFKKIMQKIFFTRTKRLRRWWGALVLVVLGIGLVTSTVVYERYVLNHDNLIDLLPTNTALYIHANTAREHHVYERLLHFMSLHPVAQKQWGSAAVQQAFAEWPEVTPAAFSEIGYAFVPVAESLQPVLLVFIQDQELYWAQKAQWQQTGWQVLEEDAIAVVSKVPFSDIAGGEVDTLADVMRGLGKNAPNAWYGYINSTYMRPFVQEQKTPLIDLLFTLAGNNAQTVAYMTTRDNTLILSNAEGALATPTITPAVSWVDRIASPHAIVGKQLQIEQVLGLLPQFHKQIGVFIPFLQYDIPQLTSKRYGVEVTELQKMFAGSVSFAYTKQSQFGADEQLVISAQMSDQFDSDVWNSFMRKAASYEYPTRKETILQDGSAIIEYVAEVSDAIEVTPEYYPTYTLYTIQSDGQIWNWLYGVRGNELFVANNKALLQAILANTLLQEHIDHICRSLTNHYLAVDFTPELAQELGLEQVVAAFDEKVMTVCTQ